MEWSEFVAAAQACGWTVFLGTITPEGHPHVALVAPGFPGEGELWFATRPSSRKYRNLQARPDVAFHWPNHSPEAPGELVAKGEATIHREDRARWWEEGVVPYDLGMFWSGPEDPDLAFVEVKLNRARLLTQRERGLERHVWTPRP